ncbi:MAG TPA: hypothetical protein VEI94_09640 [Candidatus Bathyarchaeia archaeon]|nr:hypothetical protein [Candidatus Bathyarchaeia archaeon]
MRSLWLVLLLSITACTAAVPHRVALAPHPSASATIDQAAVAEGCEGGTYRLMRVADGRQEPIYFCN